MNKIPVAVLVASFVGSVGITASLALWQDDEKVTYSVEVPAKDIAVTFSGRTSHTGDGFSNSIKLWTADDKDAIETLAKDRVSFRPIEFDIETIGEIGLSDESVVYVSPNSSIDPKVDPIIGMIDRQYLYRVDNPSQCRPGSRIDTDYDVKTTGALRRLPITPQSMPNNSSGKAYFCYVATLPETIGPYGKHKNTATVTGTSSLTEGEVKSSDEWTANASQFKPDWTEYVDAQMNELQNPKASYGDYKGSLYWQHEFYDMGDAK